MSILSLFEKNLFSFFEEEKNAKSVLKYTYTLKKFKKWENVRKKNVLKKLYIKAKN